MYWIYLVALIVLMGSLTFFAPYSIIGHIPGIRDHDKKHKIIFWSQSALGAASFLMVLVFSEAYIINLSENYKDLSLVFIHSAKNFIHIYLGISVIFLLRHNVDPLFDGIQKKRSSSNSLNESILLLLKKICIFLIITIGGLSLIQNLGYNITSLLAGLGLGGVAIALAAKDTLSNFFGSMVILIDRPFVIGDWIQFNKTEGTVESVGFRSTQIKTFYDSVVFVPNFIIANAQIDNLGKRKFRRTRFTLGINYATTPEKIKSFVEGIKDIIQNHKNAKKDYYQVSFSEYSDSSLNIFVNLFLQVKDWNEELELRQEIFLSILELSHKLNVEFAFPSQSLYIENIKNSSEKELSFEK